MPRVNLVDGLVRDEGGQIVFLGSRCSACGETIFPALPDCPLCMAPDLMEPHDILGRGTVLRAILAERGQAGVPVPYVQAHVRLDEGPVVYSTLQIDPASAGSVTGTVVEATMAHISTIGDQENVGWKFTRSSHAA